MAAQLRLLSPGWPERDRFVEDLLSFDDFGRPTATFVDEGIRYFINEFWTARQRQSHNLHEVSYRACFKAELPRFLIERLTAPGERVYDPFMGRGTTLLEAALLGRLASGNDINPLSAMLIKPRLAPPSLEDIQKRLREVDWGAGAFCFSAVANTCTSPSLRGAKRRSNPEVAGKTPGLLRSARFDEGASSNCAIEKELLAFYHPETLAEIVSLRLWFAERAAQGALDHVDEWIRMVAINRLTGHSSGFFSVYSLPPNQAVSVEAQRKINAQRNQTPPRRDVPAIIAKKSRNLLADGAPDKASHGPLMTGPASATPALADASVALIVTSPPFLDVVNYKQDNWLRCWFAGVDPDTIALDQHRTTASWERFVRDAFREFARVVRPGGHVAFEVGEVRGGKLLLERHVASATQGLPFALLGVMVNDQNFTKTANCWGVANNAKGTNTNRIVLFERL